MKPDIDTWYPSEGLNILQAQPILDFLNSGGTPGAIVRAFVQKFSSRIALPAALQDFTGDGVDELIITDDSKVLVFGCNNGEYLTLLQDSGGEGFVRYVRFLLPGDMNIDGVSEIIIDEQSGHMTGSETVTIYEWNGYEITSIIQGASYGYNKYFDFVEMTVTASIRIRDIDNNRTLDLILEGDLPWSDTSAYTGGLPWRKETRIYVWNGNQFVFNQVEFSPPEYRFQAVQDGDRATLEGKYDLALDSYQQAIFSDKLDWWSDERLRYEVAIRSTGGHSNETITPVPTLIPDPAEYGNLAAYARFRILLLHTSQGFLPEANTVYNTLQEKFSEGQAGHTYAEMAIAFWSEYQASSNLQQACDKAIEYANLHPLDILAYLGNGEYARTYYGAQSLEYKPEDICPFR